MAVKVQTQGLNSKRVAASGGRVPPGWAHAMLQAVVEEDDFVSLSFAILAHTDAAANGGKHTERLYTISSKGKDPKPLFERILYFALKLSLVTAEQIDSGEELEMEFSGAVGRQCVLHLIEEKYKDKDGVEKASSKVDWKGIFSLDDGEADQAPKDHEALALAGLRQQPSRRKQSPPAAANGKPAAPSAPVAAAPETDFGEI